jgi:hypothetical protein
MGKAGKRRRNTHYEHQSRYVRALDEAVTSLLPQFERLDPAVIEWHHNGPFGPTPDDHCIYYVTATEADRRRGEAAELSARLRRQTIDELERRDYPESGRASLTVRLVSQEAIDAAGGSFAYFR